MDADEMGRNQLYHKSRPIFLNKNVLYTELMISKIDLATHDFLPFGNFTRHLAFPAVKINRKF